MNPPWTQKFVDIYGYECDFYCPYCKDGGTYHCCLSLEYCYCSCEVGEKLRALDETGQKLQVLDQKRNDHR
jgi:hypothetical protein